MATDKVTQNRFLESCSWIVDEYNPATYTVVMVLDLVTTIPRFAPLGLEIFTAGLATPFAVAGEAGLDFGLMIIAFIVTVVMESLIADRKSLSKSVTHGIVSAAFMMFPPPVFTMVVITGIWNRKNNPRVNRKERQIKAVE